MAWNWTTEYKSSAGDPTWTLTKTPYGASVLSCDGMGNSPRPDERALIEAAPDMQEALMDSDALIQSAQKVLLDYLPPDSGITEHDVVNSLLGIFDGPEQHRVQTNTKAALEKSRWKP